MITGIPTLKVGDLVVFHLPTHIIEEFDGHRIGCTRVPAKVIGVGGADSDGFPSLGLLIRYGEGPHTESGVRHGSGPNQWEEALG